MAVSGASAEAARRERGGVAPHFVTKRVSDPNMIPVLVAAGVEFGAVKARTFLLGSVTSRVAPIPRTRLARQQLYCPSILLCLCMFLPSMSLIDIVHLTLTILGLQQGLLPYCGCDGSTNDISTVTLCQHKISWRNVRDVCGVMSFNTFTDGWVLNDVC